MLDIKDSYVTESGKWIVSVAVEDNKLWQELKAGRITGLSIGMTGHLVPRKLRWWQRVFNWFLDQLERVVARYR